MVAAWDANGIEAVELIRTHKPDVVFLDVQMPGLDGFGVHEEAAGKEDAVCRRWSLRLPTISYAVRAFEVNAVDYLLKPFDSRAGWRRTIEEARERACRRQRLRANRRPRRSWTRC